MPTMAKKKPKTGGASRDRHISPKLQFHIPQELLDAIERFQAETSPRPAISAIGRAALEDFLRSRGYWPPPGNQDGSNHGGISDGGKEPGPR